MGSKDVKMVYYNGIYNIDCAKGLAEIEPESIDIIFTDPPYISSMYAKAYGILADHAHRILRPGGWLITYAPTYHLPEIMQAIGANLEYYWTVAQINGSNTNCIIFARHVMAMWKPILIYAKAPIENPPKAFCDMVSGKRMKAHHPWEQSIHEAIHLLSRFAAPDSLVCDPFTGSGTIPLAAKLLGLSYIGFEVDPDTYSSAIQRLQQSPLDLWCYEASP